MVEDERVRRARSGLKLYLVFTEPVAAAGDRAAAREAHFAYKKELETCGLLFASGPIIEDESGKTTGCGLTILRASNYAQAEALIKDDPFVARGFRSYRIRPWRLSDGQALPA